MQAADWWSFGVLMVRVEFQNIIEIICDNIPAVVVSDTRKILHHEDFKVLTLVLQSCYRAVMSDVERISSLTNFSLAPPPQKKKKRLTANFSVLQCP